MKLLENENYNSCEDNNKLALILERKKLQTVNQEAQKYYRDFGRTELLKEQIKDAVKALKPIQIENISYRLPAKKTGVLVIADEHYDSNFELKGLNGEVINKYNTAIFEKRMWKLLAQMKADAFKYDELLIVSCGDAIEGMLRMTSLQKLRNPVMKSVIQFAEFMANWLVVAEKELQVKIRFNIIGGNHDIVRNLTSKPEFPEENLAIIIHEFIRLRLLLSKSSVVLEPYNEVFYTNVYDNKLMFVHGESGPLKDLVDFYENYYNIKIDCIYGAHLHSPENKTIGITALGDKEVVRVGSICGIDPFAKSVKKNSRASALFVVYSEQGKEISKTYYLN